MIVFASNENENEREKNKVNITINVIDAQKYMRDRQENVEKRCTRDRVSTQDKQMFNQTIVGPFSFLLSFRFFSHMHAHELYAEKGEDGRYHIIENKTRTHDRKKKKTTRRRTRTRRTRRRTRTRMYQKTSVRAAKKNAAMAMLKTSKVATDIFSSRLSLYLLRSEHDS